MTAPEIDLTAPRTCSKCGKTKPLRSFHRVRDQVRLSYCSACEQKAYKQRKRANGTWKRTKKWPSRKARPAREYTQEIAQRLDRIIAFVRWYGRQFDCSPNQREMAAAMGVNLWRIEHDLATLEFQGRIRRIKGKPRSVEVVE